MSPTAAVPGYLRTPRDAMWLGRGVEALLRHPEIGRVAAAGDASRARPPSLAGPVEALSAQRRAAPSWVRPQRLLPESLMKHLARREPRRGQRAPDRWRISAPHHEDVGAS